MKVPIALQLYSVRQDAAQDLLGVISKVAAMGYEGVEFAGFHNKNAEDVRMVLDDCGIKAEGTHTGLHQLEGDNFEPTVEYHKTIGCPWAIIPSIPEEQRNSEEACRRTADKMIELCERLRGYGMRTGFHAHAGDMKKLDNGRSAWEMFAEWTPADFIMQYDTANGMGGGADPVQPITDSPGRNASLHLKEWKGAHGAVIGEGDIPWPRVFEAAENGGGVEWYVVEYEEETEMAPMDAVKKCLDNLRAMGK
jgi:sugar phosphate isomerase/epimerase